MKLFKILAAGLLTATLIFVQQASVLASSLPVGYRYVALGDSVAAGAGLLPTDDHTDTVLCGRSTQSYPHQVASLMEIQLEHIACGGATVPAGITGPQHVGEAVFAPQIDTAFKGGRPDLITLTVGTNDVRWSDVIRKCYAAQCGTLEDTWNVAQLEWQMYNNLRSAMQQVKDKSGFQRPPQVILTGYFQPLSNNQPACFDTQGITADEINWVRLQDHAINGIIALVAAQFNFVKYAGVDFTGHELCSPQPWIQGLRDRASYHPTALGQNAIANAVLSKVRR